MNGNVRHYEHQAIKYCAWFIDNHILCLFRVCFLYNPHPPSADFLLRQNLFKIILINEFKLKNKKFLNPDFILNRLKFL